MRLADVMRKLRDIKRPRAVVMLAPGDFALINPAQIERWDSWRVVGVYTSCAWRSVACDAAVTEQQLGLLRAA